MSVTSSPSASPYVSRAQLSLEQSLLDEEIAAAEADGVIVEAVSFEPPMRSASVKQQEQSRIQELVALRNALEEALSQWQAGGSVDAKFDESTIQDQLDDLLPPVMEDEEAIKQAELIRENQDVSNYAEIRSVLQKLEKGAIKSGDMEELVAMVIAATHKALDTFESTRNAAAAEMFLDVLNKIIANIEQLAAVEVPDMRRLHQRAKHADAECGEFEVVRQNSDWSTQLSRQEASIFGEVDEVLKATRAQLDECVEIHKVLFAYKIDPVALDTTSNEAELELVHAALRRLREREAAEERKFHQLERGLDAQLAKFRERADASTQVVDSLTAHIKKLLEDLADAHLKAWRDEKKVHVCERTLSLLQKKQRMNAALAEGEEEELMRLERDVVAATEVTAIADETNQVTTETLRSIAQDRERHLVADMYDLYCDHLNLIQRKYHQTSLSIFAAESSVEIIKQEQEGVLTKKARANAAKRPELVANCNAELRALDDKLNAELDRINALQDALAALRDDWEVSYDSVSALDIDNDLRDSLIPIKTAWRDLLGSLRFVEQDTLQNVTLDNRLDATFLSQK